MSHPIGTLNCRHTIYSIIIGVSEPTYSEDDLQAIKEASLRKTEFDGKDMTNYEASQVQRRLEREIRKQKNKSVIAASTGNDEMRRESQMKVNQLTGKYKDLSDTFGLKTKAERISACENGREFTSKIIFKPKNDRPGQRMALQREIKQP